MDNSSYYAAITSSIQFLSGLVHGLMADGELGDKEIFKLKSWMESNDFLAGTYPFDEINSLRYTVLADLVVTKEDRED